jgi:naphthalene 1,2-dioxygenase system ferredoxin subunit
VEASDRARGHQARLIAGRSSSKLNPDTQWIDAAGREELPPDAVIGLVLAGRDLALYTVGDAVYATDNTCTHGQARLCDGFLDGHEIECPLHPGKFDVRDGRPTSWRAGGHLRKSRLRYRGSIWGTRAPNLRKVASRRYLGSRYCCQLLCGDSGSGRTKAVILLRQT